MAENNTDPTRPELFADVAATLAAMAQLPPPGVSPRRDAHEYLTGLGFWGNPKGRGYYTIPLGGTDRDDPYGFFLGVELYVQRPHAILSVDRNAAIHSQHDPEADQWLRANIRSFAIRDAKRRRPSPNVSVPYPAGVFPSYVSCGALAEELPLLLRLWVPWELARAEAWAEGARARQLADLEADDEDARRAKAELL